MPGNKTAKRLIVVCVGLALSLQTGCWTDLADSSPRRLQKTVQSTDSNMQWWTDARFGMFIHWGPVSLKGTEIGWSRGKEVPVEEYDRLYKRFNPQQFNAAEWVSLAKQAGMKYLVLTAKHHDGFCLWDSEYTDYDIMSTPFGRDVVKELSEECKRGGIKFCTYYSVLDWYQPDYNTTDNQGGPGYTLADGKQPDINRYVDYMKGQLQELIENYGPVGIAWFDGDWEPQWKREHGTAIYNHVKSLQPDIIINNRVGKGRQGWAGKTKKGFLGDYDTPEQQIGSFQIDRPWETCMTLCTQWAWKPNDKMKSLKQCIQTLIRTAGGDGNFLFNVGPMPDGRIEPRQAKMLTLMGKWLGEFGQSIYETRGGPFKPSTHYVSTHKDNEIYIHILNWPDNNTITLPPIKKNILDADLLTGGRVKINQTETGTKITVDKEHQHSIDTIVILKLDANASDIEPLDPVG